MSTSLCLHTGAVTVDRQQIAAVATPPRTSTWVPIAHHRFLDGVQACLERSGLRIVDESHGLTKDGNRYFGLLRIGNDGAALCGNDFGVVVGLRNSHDKKFPAGLVVGASVFVCDNLSFSGEVKLARKHTSNVERDLPQLIERAVGRLGDLRRTQDARFTRYHQHELSDLQAHDLAIRSLDAGVVPVTRLPLLISEWREPRHPEFREGGRTAWRFFNAATESLKGNLDALPRRTQALHGLLDAACGFAVERN